MENQKLRWEIENAIRSSIVVLRGHPIERAVDKIIKIIHNERRNGKKQV